MRKQILLVVLLVCGLNLFSSEIKVETLKAMKKGIVYDKKEYKKIENTSNNTIKYIDDEGNSFTSKSEIIIKLKNESDIEKFELKYGLKFKKRMLIGDYIFENNGNKDTLHIINQILIDDSSSIDRIIPNSILNMKSL